MGVFYVSCHRNVTTELPEISGKAYLIRHVAGVHLFPNEQDECSAENMLLVVIDPSKKQITVVKKSMVPFW